MENYFKITKAEAAKLGAFEYAPHQAFDPFVSEQIDDSYIVSETCYELLKAHPNFQKVDFNKKQKIEESELQTKEKILQIPKII